jgi:hypothetical protein
MSGDNARDSVDEKRVTVKVSIFSCVLTDLVGGFEEMYGKYPVHMIKRHEPAFRLQLLS